jgi:hypothetical protein
MDAGTVFGEHARLDEARVPINRWQHDIAKSACRRRIDESDTGDALCHAFDAWLPSPSDIQGERGRSNTAGQVGEVE